MSQKQIHVAVGVIVNAQQQVLIAKRPQHAHQGGLWEFPGGKVEANESVFEALTREIKEEVGIDIQQAQALMMIEHDYGDKKVVLDVYLSTDFAGEANGLEGQEIAWVAKHELKNYAFPAANSAIIEKFLISNF